MKLGPLKLIIFPLITGFILVSCNLNSNNYDADVYSDPSFSSLKFTKLDSFPNQQKAKFTLEWDNALFDSVIINVDSLPFLTKIDTVKPSFSFKSTNKAYVHFLKGDSLEINNKDSMNFDSINFISNLSYHKDKYRKYPIRVNVHKVNPEVYVWRKINDGIYTHAGSRQRCIINNDQLYLFVNTGLKNYLHTSSDGINWSEQTVNGLPSDIPLNNILGLNGLFYTIDASNNYIYSSSDLLNWAVKYTSSDFNYKFINLLFVLNGKVWMTVQSGTDANYYIASLDAVNGFQVRTQVPDKDKFPVGDFASLAFAGRTGFPKAIVVGGVSSEGNTLYNTWSTEDGVNWVNLAEQNTTMNALPGAAIVWYDSKLLLFGKTQAVDYKSVNRFLVSKDEGLSWQVPDSTVNVMYDSIRSIAYEARSYQSAVVNSNNQLFVVGGNDGKLFTDVWRAKLNRLGFKRQDGERW